MKKSKATQDVVVERRVIIFRCLDYIRSYLMIFLQRELELQYENWVEEGIPEEVKKEPYFLISLKKARSEKDPLLSNLSFKDYSKIITYKKNWNNIFSSLFKDKTPREIEDIFIELQRLRNLAYYTHFVSESDARLAELLVRELLIDEVAKREFEETIKGGKLTNTEIKIMGPFVLQLNGCASAEEIAKLTELPIHIVKLTLKHSFLRMGLVSFATGAELASGIVAGAPILEERKTFPKSHQEIYFLKIPKDELLRRFPQIMEG